jgi:hypothetical protein
VARQRVYVPYTFERLLPLHESGQLGPAPFLGYAVTSDVLAQTEDSDDEEREHFVALVAARASLEFLVDDPAAAWRRVVVAIDVDDAAVQAVPHDGCPAAVQVFAASRLEDVAAIFVDDPASQQLIALASQTRDPSLVDDVDLLWFAPTELDDLLH